MTRIELDIAVLAALPPRITPVERLFILVAGQVAGITFGTFFETLMDLERRGLVVTNEVTGRGDSAPALTVAHPHLDRPIRTGHER